LLLNLTRTSVPTPSTSDPQQLAAWLAAAALHDKHAFQQLYQACSSKLFGFAVRILGKHELAEEAVQDAFVSIWHSAAAYQPHLAAPMTWMATIVRNKALDILRRTDDTVELDMDEFDSDMMHAREPQSSASDLLELSDHARALAQCMAGLEGSHRQAIGMAYLHDLSHSEVAQRLSLPIGTVKTWIRRGLERLKLCMNKREAA
jgi:RNA polymerase sigma-70 factor (ECF subfamily)